MKKKFDTKHFSILTRNNRSAMGDWFENMMQKPTMGEISGKQDNKKNVSKCFHGNRYVSVGRINLFQFSGCIKIVALS